MKAYIVGGWVRDKLLGINSQDKDWVVVGASPEELLDQGYKQVGASFPVFLHPKTQEEYALARTERKIGTGYHGFRVSFDKTVTLEEDLMRRDLSINAIAFDEDTQDYIDPFGGKKDLEKKILRHVSDAFAEDPLRIVRLARFHSLFADFSLDTTLLHLVESMVKAGSLKELAKERIVKEFEKAHRAAHHIEVFWRHCLRWQIIEQVFSEKPCPWEKLSVYYQSYGKRMGMFSSSHRLAIALAFYEIASESTEPMSKHFSNKIHSMVNFIKRTMNLKNAWSLETFTDFILHSRLLHQEKRTLFADLFSLPMSNIELESLICELQNEDKSSWINTQLEMSPERQLKEQIQKVIMRGQYQHYFQ